MIKRIEAITVCFAVIAWLLPLGAFIKPSQEAASCGGKRAFHMCCIKVNPQSDGAAKVSPDRGSFAKEKGGFSSDEMTSRETAREVRQKWGFFESVDEFHLSQGHPHPVFRPPIPVLP